MDTKETEKDWEKLINETFNTFIREKVGLDAEGRPACFGTGDAKSYCTFCSYREIC